MTKDGPVENIYVPGVNDSGILSVWDEDCSLDVQSRCLDSGSEQWRRRPVPAAEWVNKVVGTEYQALGRL